MRNVRIRWGFSTKSFVTWELCHVLDLREAPAADQFWGRICEVCDVPWGALQPACTWKTPGSCLHAAHDFFLQHVSLGELGHCTDVLNPLPGAVWAWSLSWEAQTKLCILNLSLFFDLSSMSGTVRESAWAPVTSFVPLTLDWWLLTELTQPCLCQKQWDIWIYFSFYVLIWMSAHLCAC